jgi:hypothetical protein
VSRCVLTHNAHSCSLGLQAALTTLCAVQENHLFVVCLQVHVHALVALYQRSFARVCNLCFIPNPCIHCTMPLSNEFHHKMKFFRSTSSIGKIVRTEQKFTKSMLLGYSVHTYVCVSPRTNILANALSRCPTLSASDSCTAVAAARCLLFMSLSLPRSTPAVGGRESTRLTASH